MAVGVMPAFVAANVSELATAGTSMTVPLPSEVQPGDMMVVFVKNNGTSATPPNPPDGWNYLGSTASGNYYHVFWRIRVSGGDTEPTFVMPNSARHQAHVLVYRNVGSIGNFSAVSPSNGTASYVHPAVDVDTDNSVAVFARDFSTTAATGSWAWTNATERTDNALTYTSGVTNLFSTADVNMPVAGMTPTIQSVATGTVSNGTTRAVSFVLYPTVPSAVVKEVRTTQATTPSNTTAIPVDLPSSVAVDDTMIAFVSMSADAAGQNNTLSMPSGWTLLAPTTNVSGNHTGIWKKKYAASDGTSVTCTTSVGDVWGYNASVMVLKNDDYDNIVAGSALVAGSGTSTTTIPIPGITPTKDNSLLVALASFFSSARATFLFPWTEIVDIGQGATSSRFNNQGIATKPQATAAATGTITATISGSNPSRMGILLAVPYRAPVLVAGSFFPFFS